jgi:hypothetical protein
VPLSKIEQARAEGYSDDEIMSYLGPKIAEAQAAGYTEDEIGSYLGIRPVDVAAVPAGEVNVLRGAGFSEAEIQAYIAPQVEKLQSAGFSPDEIAKHFGIRPIDVAAANNALAARVHSEIVKGQNGGNKQIALEQMSQTVKDAATVYAPIEAALNVATGAAFGFPGYLIGGIGGDIAHWVYSPDTDPKEIAKTFSDALTYQPHTEAGARFTSALTYPLRALMDMSESAGKTAAEKTGSPVAGALTEATIQMLPSFLIPALGRAVKGKVPTHTDIRETAASLAGERATPEVVSDLADKVQDVYEKTGIDPETLLDEARRDVRVKQDLVSSNRMPFQAEKPPAPAAPSAPAPEPSAAQAAILARISVGEKTVASHSFDALYTAAKDDLYPIASIEKKLAGGADLATAESPYKLARLTRGSAGKATQFLDYGTFDFKTYENTGPALKAILEPIKDDLSGFRAYAVARRAVELEGRGIETGVPAAEARAVVDAGAKYAEPFAKLQTYQESLVKYLRDSGVISADAYSAMLEANKDYVPFHRLVEGGSAGAGRGVRNPLRAIKGSTRTIVDPLESIIKNTYLYTAIAERNAASAALGKLIEANPETAADLGISRVPASMRPIEVSAEELARAGVDAEAFTIFRPNALRPAPDQIRYFENGKPVTLQVPREVADAFNATDRQTANMLVSILAVPARTLRAGSVLTPDFMLRNVIRDQLTAFSFSKNGYIPVWDLLSGALSLAKKDAAFQDWLKSGGANSTMVALDRQYLQQHIFQLDAETGIASRAWNVAKSPLEVLRITSELFENATRLGEFKKAVREGKAGIQAAGFESREVTLDFQRIGAQARGLNMIAAFMNAGLEGLDRTARAFKDAPIATTAKVATGITLPSVLLWYANNSTPERQKRWREIENWERDLFWIVMTDEHTYRIPKPFEVGVIFGSLPERMLDKFAADKPAAMKDFMSTLGQAFGVNVLPTAAVPLLEQTTGHSFFTGNPLIPSRMENLLPEYQSHEYSTQLSRAVGHIVGAFPGLHDKSIASPVVIDNYIRGWTGSLGIYIEQALDASLRKANVLPDPPQPLATLADIPVVKAFIVRYPSASAQSVQDFYEAYTERKRVYDTFQYLVKNGDPEAALMEADLAPNAFVQMEGIHQSIGAINSAIRAVYKSPDMSPSDKRQIIDALYGQMIELARAGNQAMAAVDKALGK